MGIRRPARRSAVPWAATDQHCAHCASALPHSLTSELPISASEGRPTAVPCARSVRQRRGASPFRPSRVGVLAQCTALYWSWYLQTAEVSAMKMRAECARRGVCS